MSIATRAGMVGMAAFCLWCGAARGDGVVVTNAPAARTPPADKREKTMHIVEHTSGQWSPGLTDAEKETLFAIVEDTLQWCVNGSKGTFDFGNYTVTDKLKVPTATFVTLKEGGDLRGCIGSLQPADAMYLSLHNNAVYAALRDQRFAPVRPGELPLLEVHISLLSPIVDIAGPEEFKIGEHGIIIEKGPFRAVYLPEVAVEQKWTKEETLSSLSMKAGLSPDAWKKSAKFKVFSSVGLSRENADAR
jgi:AmmeMemoRadiSam system protein A